MKEEGDELDLKSEYSQASAIKKNMCSILSEIEDNNNK